jgi:hypothetical protein
MLAVGLPIFLRMRLPWRKKIPLVGVFSLGIFVILASILNKVYSFTEPFGSMWTVSTIYPSVVPSFDLNLLLSISR